MDNKNGAAQENELSKHGAEFRKKAADIGQDVRELGKITREIAGDTVGLLGGNANEYYRQGVEKARELSGTLEEKIRQNPLQALLIAAGVGVILGAIWKKR